MAELVRVFSPSGEAEKHAIFIHGLGGHFRATWTPSRQDEPLWLQWLAEDIPGLATWSLGYQAPKIRWRRDAMHLTDQAPTLFALLLAEPQLRTGEITLVGHSLGGLIIKQLLRVGQSRAQSDVRAETLFHRVRRIAFLATPHSGTALANWADTLRIMMRPSTVIAGLRRNDPYLRDLNQWYREWAAAHGIRNLVLMETQATTWLGLTVVLPDSADPGLLDQPLSVSANHVSICKPDSRASELYVLIRDFIRRPVEPDPTAAPADQTPANTSTLVQALENLTEAVRSQSTVSERVAERLERAASASSNETSTYVRTVSSTLADSAIREQLTTLQQARFFGGFDSLAFAKRLSHSIRIGDLSSGSDAVRSQALAWCARLLFTAPTSVDADTALAAAEQLGESSEVSIARACRLAVSGSLSDALEQLSGLAEPAARTVAFFLAVKYSGSQRGFDWLSASGFTDRDLDSDGKLILIGRELEASHWSSAISHAAALTETDFAQAPGLLQHAAITRVLQVAPEELRMEVLRGPPVIGGAFPLASDRPAMTLRADATTFFLRASGEAKRLGCEDAANLAEDFALWLQLRDPISKPQASSKLSSSLREPAHALRRVPLALQFGLPLDRAAVESEIIRRVALSGGKIPPDVSLARVALALAAENPRSAAIYLDNHRDDVLAHYPPEWLGSLQIEMYVRAGDLTQASQKLKELEELGIPEPLRGRLRRIIASRGSESYVTQLISEFELSGTLPTLMILVEELERGKDWSQLSRYADLLFQKTLALSDAERAAVAFRRANRTRDLAAFLRAHTDLIFQSEILQVLWAWSLYLSGDLSAATAVLATLPGARATSAARELAARLAVASGDWPSLLPLLEDDWSNRDRRSPAELLSSAYQAYVSGSPRARDLLFAAASKANDDPQVLVGAYSLASHAGWDDDAVPAGWIMRAAELSGASGPVQRKSIADVLELKPDWDRQTSEAWRDLRSAAMPAAFVAARLRRSLVELFIFPAIANLSEPDPRRRPFIPAFTGMRAPSRVIHTGRAVLEPTALLTLAMLDLLPAVERLFPDLIIPHTMLPWLFNEKFQAPFHQPSRVRSARTIRQMLATKTLSTLRPTVTPDAELTAQIGVELAQLLTEATRITEDGNQAFVVASGPIYLLGSMMREEADLTRYRARLCSCTAVVDKLKERAGLTATEESRARAYLSLHERRWPDEPQLPDGALLLLSDVSVSYLQHLGLLDKLAQTGLSASISLQEDEHTTALIAYDDLSTQVTQVIERARSWLAAGISRGAIQVSSLGEDPTDEETSELAKHPSVTALELLDQSTALLSDDRALNQARSPTNEIVSSLDILEEIQARGLIGIDRWLDIRTALRRSGYVFVPVTEHELRHHLAKTTVSGDVLVETAELRAIRENLLLARMSGVIQLPPEKTWLDDTASAIIGALRAEWTDECAPSDARARSNWLLHRIDLRGWSFPMGAGNPGGLQYIGHVAAVARLLVAPPEVSKAIADAYKTWLDEDVLAPLAQTDPSAYSWLMERAKDLISLVESPGGSAGSDL